MGRDHIVPLSKQALDVIKSLPHTSEYLLPMQTDDDRPMAANTVADAIRAMGFNHTAHGFRATARTVLDEVLDQRVDLIEHQLSHQVKDANGRAYNRTAHLPARKVMMQEWADYLDKLRKGTPHKSTVKAAPVGRDKTDRPHATSQKKLHHDPKGINGLRATKQQTPLEAAT